ncbi:MAG TPA: hypothetical protein PLP86_11440 [Armatimonadota bacterium]|jgi:outer membrane lipoprotein-sorting protein|nr:hypothetical protein [Armatimonadota bacterium]HOM72846.1 hypothetical protein [Armatimonadota bacterium]
MRKFRLLLCLMCMVVVQLPLVAEEPADTSTKESGSAITAEQIIEKSIEATGGRKAFDKIKSSVMKGSNEMAAMNIKMDFTVYTKAPNKMLMVQALPFGMGEMKIGFDGKTGWSSDTMSGLRTLTGPELEMLKKQAQVNADLNWREYYKNLELVGTKEINGRSAYEVQFTPKDIKSADGKTETPGLSKPVTQYYDKETFMLLRMDMTMESPQGTQSVQVYPSDWRVVDGVKVPFVTKTITSVGDMVTKIVEFKTNPELDDSLFAMPAEDDTEEAEE